MISHIHIGTNDLEPALTFYSNVLGVLGLRLKFSDDDRAWAGWVGEDERPLFLVGAPDDGEVHNAGNGQMVAFLASSRAQVDDCYQVAIKHGAQDEGKPGPRPQYHKNYYGAYFRDLDGNKICICCHSPEK